MLVKSYIKLMMKLRLMKSPSHILRLRLALGSSQVENKPWDHSSLKMNLLLRAIDAP